MKKHRILILFAVASSLLLSPLSYAKENPLPTTAEELKKWIVGTEWVTTENSNKGSKRLTRRFLKGGMQYQRDTAKWDLTKPFFKCVYKITGPNTIQYGENKWTIVFSDDFQSFKGTGKGKKRRTSGKLSARFE